jgi:WD40 repeat protein/uncharacterized protein YjbI with pentapeptide repeats/3',5'-cyclic AMP phosphodiesterase CpdA
VARGEGSSLDFFISYTPADTRWATWIAWQLESAGYTTMVQAWDFVPGVPFMDHMDRGLREARVVVAVLSRRYLHAEYCRMEWQTALRTDPRMLVTVRIEDCPLEGLLASITYVDLVGVPTEQEARAALLTRLRHTLEGRGKPSRDPGFPPHVDAPPPDLRALSRPPRRRTPAVPPAYPPRLTERTAPREAVSVLHVPGPRFGRVGDPVGPGALQERIWADITTLADRGAPAPDLVVVSGDLTESARLREIDDALRFLVGLRDMIGVEPDRLIVVPGSHDVSRPACRAYFAQCEAKDRLPQLPFYPKFEHYADLFVALYHGLDGAVFDSGQPWTLFDIPDLRVAVAGLNSTMGINDRPEEDHGLLTEVQATWFANRLRRYEEAGWLRIGVVRHDPVAADDPNGGEADVLRDAGTLDRLLGRRLNLLLHGPGPGGPRIGRLGSDLPVVPAAGSEQHEIIEVMADGLRRWRPDTDRPETDARRWHACTATFARSDAQPQDSEPSEQRAILDPTSLLLERVEEVCRARDGQAKVRRVERLNQLLVTRMDGGIATQRRIGAIVGEPSRADLEAFLATDPDMGSELVYQSPTTAPRALREEALLRGVRLCSFTEFQGLLDLADYVTRQTGRLRSDRLYSPDLYVPQRFRELDRAEQPVRDDLAAELMRLAAADQGSFVLVLGDFGRGKTFVLREVARRIAEQLPHLVPILIELRALDKAHSVEGLVAAHLANHGEKTIDLSAFRYMLRQGRVVLLFDGFDELVTRVTYDRATEHLDTLLGAARDDAKIILSSRTQYFQSNAQVLMALGERVGLLSQRRILSVEDFSRAQIRSFLVNRYASTDAADRRLGLISGIQDLLGLSQNPRMLSFIADLDERRLLAVARAGSPVSAAGLYEEILNTWLTHEATRAHGERGTLAGLSVDALWRAVSVLAQRLWAAGESVLRLEDLSGVADTLSGLSEVPLSLEQTAHAMGAGSLLVRTEEGAFGFIHDSVAEWLVAAEIARELTSDPPENPAQLGQRMLSQLTVEFLCDLAGVQASEAWTGQVLSSQRPSEIVWTNAMRITGRLRTSPTADLRGASLHGEDLSGRNFQGVDFTGADLSETLLVGADLAGSILRDARLVGARLDGANLSGADLTNADFTRARLGRTDLRDATFTGSRWNLASLIQVTGLPDAIELRGAAIVPGQEVVTVFAPAEISVRHGFHPAMGRLPQSIAYSHDGGTLAIGSDDGGVLVCETANGRPVRNLQGHRGRVFAVTYGPDDRLLVTGASDGDVRVWDAATGRCLHVLEGHADWAWPVVVDPTGDVVASGDRTGLLRLWSTRTGSLLLTMPHEQDVVYTAAFHPGGGLLAAGYHDGVVRMWDTSTGESVGVLQGETRSVFRVAFDPSGSILAVAEAEGTLRLWDSRLERQLHRLTGHAGSVYTVAFHPRAPVLASGDTNGVVRMWDVTTGDCTAVLRGHEQPVYWVAFSPLGDLLASGDGAGAVRLWDVASGDLRHDLSGHSGSVWPFAFRRDGAQLAISDDQFTVRLWDPSKGRTQHVLTGHGRQVTSVSFSADGASLATSGNDGVVRLWNPGTGQLQQTLLGTEDRLVTLQAAAFDPGGRLLATVSNDGRVNLRNLETGQQRHLNVESPPVWALAFSPSGDSLATANDDDTVRLWWRHNGRLMHTLGDHRGRVRSIAFHPKDPVLATGCGDQKVRLWSTETGQLLATLEGHTDRVYAVSYSEDGTLLASASWDGSIRVWSSGGVLRHVMREHAGRLYAAAFAPSGTLVASAGDDLVIRLWDAASGEHIHTLVGHSRRVWSLAFSPTGSTLASAGDDGTARLWSLDGQPDLKLTLIGRQDGWAAIALDGRYKVSGDVGGQFWHAIGMCRFDPGELDDYLGSVRHLPADAEF